MTVEANQLLEFLVSKYGLGVAFGVGMSMFIGFLLVLVLRWVIKQQDHWREEASARENRLVGIIEGQNKALAEHNQVTSDFRNEIKNAMQYQRDEHKAQMDLSKDMLQAVHRMLERSA